VKLPKSDDLLKQLMDLHPKIIDLTLDRMHRLLDALDNPQRNLPPVIHIAGTNGKGSTQAMLRAGLEGSGHSVLTEILDECRTANGDIPITYFEITTCAALLAFARTPADYTLLEVGLGGRLDATNVVSEPAMTIITPVSIDHEQYLGDTLGKIAFEKAGILKPNTFCVVGPQQDEALDVIETQAARVGATLKTYGQHWHVWEEGDRLIFQDERGLLDLPKPALIGAHQVQNAGAALAALRLLGVDDASFDAAMTDARWPARMQKLSDGPLLDAAPQAELWLDGGHNAAAGTALAEALGRLPKRPMHMIVGMLNTKDVTGYLKPLANLADTLTGVSIPGEAATLSAEETVDAARSVGLRADVADSVAQAVADIAKTDPAARILICGSLYLAGHILRENS